MTNKSIEEAECARYFMNGIAILSQSRPHTLLPLLWVLCAWITIMQISKFKEIGEALSIVAVLITLVFLILEVRENTAAIRTESYGESITRLNDWRLQLASDKELTRMFAQFNSGNLTNLDGTESQQFSFVYGSLWSIYESAYFARSYGTLGESEWIRFEQMMCRQFELVTEQDYWSSMDLLLSPEFKSYAQAQCE
ncbi:MAG: hypothetical protein O2971_08665 [Proteobacteria bacterium]|nr:hypothetical protein [Pseudomonadota bacterium]